MSGEQRSTARSTLAPADAAGPPPSPVVAPGHAAPEPATPGERGTERVTGGRRAARRWLTVWALWTAFGLWTASQYHLYGAATGRPVESWWQPYAISLASAWLWAAMTPLLALLARRYRVERQTWQRHLPIHLAAAVAVAVLDAAVDSTLYPVLSGHPARPYLPQLLGQLNTNLFAYFVVVAVTHAADYYRWYRERQLRAAQLETQLTRAQLEVLKMQLQPHFLFNTLHAIAELVHEDPATADRMITRLGDLLRLTVDNVGTQEVPLERELEFLAAYLEIEQTRFRDRLSVQMEIEPETLDALVPNLLLQPLVENAIRHGTARHAAQGLIKIVARRQYGVLQLVIADNGRGLPDRAARRAGIGLRNTRARLKQLYGAEHRFEIRNRPGAGVAVFMAFPFRTRPDDGAADAAVAEARG